MMRADLRVIGGKHHDKIITLPVKKFLIGRELDCHLRPNSESVSRHHCAITLDDYGVHVRDLGSTNGTFVNDEQIQGMVMLNSGDKLMVGKLEFEVLIHKTAPVTAATGGGSESTDLPMMDEETAEGDMRATAQLSSEETDHEISVMPPSPSQTPAEPLTKTGIYSGDTTITSASELPPQPAMEEQQKPQESVSRIKAPPLRLPKPEETGIKAETDAIGSGGAESKDEGGDTKQDASNLAADIIRKYRNRNKEDETE